MWKQCTLLRRNCREEKATMQSKTSEKIERLFKRYNEF